MSRWLPNVPWHSRGLTCLTSLAQQPAASLSQLRATLQCRWPLLIQWDGWGHHILLFHFYACLSLSSCSFKTKISWAMLRRGLPLTSQLISHPLSHRMSPLHFLLPMCLPRCSGHASWKAKQKEHSEKHAWPHFPLCLSFYFSLAFLSQITGQLTKPLHTHYHRMLSSCSLSSVSTILGYSLQSRSCFYIYYF